MNRPPVRELLARASARVRTLAALLGAFVMQASCWAAPADAALNVAAGLPAEITGSLGVLLDRGGLPASGFGSLGRPSLGALSARGPASLFLSQRLRFPGGLQALPVPASLSVVMWVRLSSDQPCQPLFGFGEPDGDYFLASTDSTGAPTLAFLNREKVTQFDRARMGAANLADGQLHAIVAVINLGSGLVRLYVDGRPETASTTTLWRPREFGSAFALYALQGRTEAPGNEVRGLLMPRIIPRELSDQEIAILKPDGNSAEAVAVNPKFGASLVRDTLMEFWPPEYSYQLRWRPL